MTGSRGLARCSGHPRIGAFKFFFGRTRRVQKEAWLGFVETCDAVAHLIFLARFEE